MSVSSELQNASVYKALERHLINYFPTIQKKTLDAAPFGWKDSVKAIVNLTKKMLENGQLYLKVSGLEVNLRSKQVEVIKQLLCNSDTQGIDLQIKFDEPISPPQEFAKSEAYKKFNLKTWDWYQIEIKINPTLLRCSVRYLNV